MSSLPQFPIGTSDFAKLRQQHYHYVDKSLFVEQILQDSAEVLLFLRPRRFGKTLNLSTFRYFIEKPTSPFGIYHKKTLKSEAESKSTLLLESHIRNRKE